MKPSGTLFQGKVVSNQWVAPDHCEMVLHLPETFGNPAPGQFVMVRSAEHHEPLLARPLSVYRFTRETGLPTLHLLYRVVGAGTALLSRLVADAPLTVLGPLGSGFDWIEQKRALFVAGGVGVAPLVHFLETISALNHAAAISYPVCYLGAKTKSLLLARDRLAGLCDLRICTDDGSDGYHGLVTERLDMEIADFTPERTALYACGPGSMIRSLASLLANRPSYTCQVSLEERMACGFGVCLGCAVGVRNGEGEFLYQQVCTDGPVFPLAAILPPGKSGEGYCL